MKKGIIAALAAGLLLFALPVSAADAIHCWDFEGASLKSIEKEGFATYKKSSRIELETLDGSTVLAFRHAKLDKGEDSYADLLGGGIEKYGVKPIYCLIYDFRYTGEMKCSWQILCSRQVPAAGTKFQQVGYVDAGGVLRLSKSEATVTLKPDQWYNFAVVMNETDNLCDFYLDGILMAEAMPYSIDDASAANAERIRIGFSGGDAESVVFVDNVRILNEAAPDNLVLPDIEVVADEMAAADTFALPRYESEISVSRPVWFAIGTAASLLLAAVGVLLLRKLNRGGENV